MERPSVTLFMLVSADGKISLGNKSNNDLLLDLMKMQDINSPYLPLCV